MTTAPTKTRKDEERIRLAVEVPRDLWRWAKQRALDADSDLRSVVIEALEAARTKAARKKGGGSVTRGQS